MGSHREKVLNNHGISTIHDLLYYFPRRHLDRTTISPIRNFTKGDVVTLIGTVETFGEKSTRRGKIFQVIVSDGTGLLTLTWFNGVRYIKNLFKIGDKLAIHGKVDYYGGFTITHPEFDKLEKDDDPISTGKVIPLYSLTQELKSGGIDQRFLRQIVKEVLDLNSNIPEIFQQYILDEHDLISLKDALNKIHFSNGIGELNQAIHRLKFDEHFFLQLLMALRKRSLQDSGSLPLPDIGPYFKLISETLDFELTDAQKKVIKEIHSDLKNPIPMNRLLQGDVGSGKTIVSILISALAVGNSAQVAMMVPTEILATQHFHSFKSELEKVNIPCALLVGNMKKLDRSPILAGLENGKIPMVIGTHALIQEDVNFKNLGLVIVDEQHRFGVNQRAKLVEKGNNPHFLAMTATPIPRTLSITYHGDMDLSIIDEMPKNRMAVTTKVVNENRMVKVYKFIVDEIAAGRQCMVVYPLVKETENSDLAAATEGFEKLEKQFNSLNVGLIHGRIKKADKDGIMESFANNEINILVATTVIEVGIDVPNASVMLIEHAERFGLTQLHQLRGRVGRGSNKSYCILVERNVTPMSRRRLTIMENTNDGFIIADEDLKMRGPGKYFSTEQSGFFRHKIADIVNDGPIIRKAREAAKKIVKKDPLLKKHFLMKERLLKEYAQYLDTVNIT